MAVGWKKKKLLEWGVVGWEQELMGRINTRSCSFCLAGRGRHRDLGVRFCPGLSQSVLCKGECHQYGDFLFFLLPAAMALVPVLLQLGEGWLGGLLGAGGGRRGYACLWGFSEQQLESGLSFLSLPFSATCPSHGHLVSSCALMHRRLLCPDAVPRRLHSPAEYTGVAWFLLLRVFVVAHPAENTFLSVGFSSVFGGG